MVEAVALQDLLHFGVLHRAFALLLSGDVKADVVFLVGPVDADEGCKGGGRFLHGEFSSKMSRRDMQSRPSEGNTESR